MMMSSNGKIYALQSLVKRIHWSPVDSRHKGQWGGASMGFLSAPEQTVQQKIERSVIWDVIVLIMTLVWWSFIGMSIREDDIHLPTRFDIMLPPPPSDGCYFY